MPFDSMLDHKCDIYHVVKKTKSPGYGLPASTLFSYLDEPDISAAPCHFSTKTGTVGGMTVVQAEPQAKYEAGIKLTLPFGTDIRLNDKVIDCSTGYEYTAEIPRNVRNHHIFVLLHRSAQQEAL